MKYTFKEKQKHFTDLGNPAAASVDLELLLQKKPDIPEAKKFARDPKRYANDILYRLLDFTERDEIRKHRREKLEPVKTEDDQTNPPADDQPVPGEKKPEGELTEPPAGDNSPAGELDTASNLTVEELEQLRLEKEAAEERADEAEKNLEETEESLEEEQDARHEAEERAEKAEAALEEEKKKVPAKAAPVKSKSTKSTRK